MFRFGGWCVIVKEMSEGLDRACDAADGKGWFAQLNQPPTVVGSSILPGGVPVANVSTTIAQELAVKQESCGDDCDGED